MDLDRSSEFVGRGWRFPVTPTQNGGIGLASGVSEIEQAMYLILATAPGERPMRPEFGCPLIDYVFSPLDATSMAQIANAVRSALERWEPRVHVLDVQVVPDPDRTTAVVIDISYRIRDTYDRRNLVFPFYVIPDHE